jgi:3'-5' exoribonuclease
MALGDLSTIKALITSVEKSETSRGGSMLKLRYRDEKTVERSSVMFENKHTLFPELSAIAYTVCELTVEESSYNGNPSTKILKILPLPEEDRSRFVRKTKIDVEAAVEEMRTALVSDPDFGPLLNVILFENAEMLKKFKCWPAASGMHHAFDGGLLEHTFMMFKGAQAIMNVDVAYDGVDKNVVLAAIILHDIGKVVEYDYQIGLKIETSMIGTCLGHISIADSMIVRACTKKNIPLMAGRVLQLRHCILSHHGKKEWGSPVLPSTREAVLVHQMDQIQARGEMAFDASNQAEQNSTVWSKGNDSHILRWN